MSIKVLPEEIRNRIRSGIAINTVAQCVEELVQNSLDAESSCIAVRLDLQFFKIQVVDNGIGISYNDLKLVGDRYATSKCSSLTDLENTRFYGYRGEALASICEVSGDVTVVTEQIQSKTTHVKIIQNGSSQPNVNLTTRRPSHGTTVTVWGFLHNMPVRQSAIDVLLDTEKTRKCLEALALIHPNVSITLRDNGTDAWCLVIPKSSSVPKTFGHLFGSCWIQHLKRLTHSEGDYAIGGYLSTKGHRNRNLQFLYVHRRRILGHRLQRAISEVFEKHATAGFVDSATDTSPLQQSSNSPRSASHSSGKYQLARPVYGTTDVFPVFVLEIDCPRKSYDVGLHPTKSIIEFKNYDLLLALAKQLAASFLHLYYDVIPPLTEESKSPSDLVEPLATALLSRPCQGIAVQNVRHSIHSLPAKRPFAAGAVNSSTQNANVGKRLLTEDGVEKAVEVAHFSSAFPDSEPVEKIHVISTSQSETSSPSHGIEPTTSRCGKRSDTNFTGLRRRSDDGFNEIKTPLLLGPSLTMPILAVSQQQLTPSWCPVGNFSAAQDGKNIHLTTALCSGKTAVGKLSCRMERSERIAATLSELKKFTFTKSGPTKTTAQSLLNADAATMNSCFSRIPTAPFRDSCTAVLQQSKTKNDKNPFQGFPFELGALNRSKENARHMSETTKDRSTSWENIGSSTNNASRLNMDKEQRNLNAVMHDVATSPIPAALIVESRVFHDRVPFYVTVRPSVDRSNLNYDRSIVANRTTIPPAKSSSEVSLQHSRTLPFTNISKNTLGRKFQNPRSFAMTRDMIYQMDDVTEVPYCVPFNGGGCACQLQSHGIVEEDIHNNESISKGSLTTHFENQSLDSFSSILSRPTSPLYSVCATQPFSLVDETQSFTLTNSRMDFIPDDDLPRNGEEYNSSKGQGVELPSDDKVIADSQNSMFGSRHQEIYLQPSTVSNGEISSRTSLGKAANVEDCNGGDATQSGSSMTAVSASEGTSTNLEGLDDSVTKFATASQSSSSVLAAAEAREVIPESASIDRNCSSELENAKSCSINIGNPNALMRQSLTPDVDGSECLHSNMNQDHSLSKRFEDSQLVSTWIPSDGVQGSDREVFINCVSGNSYFEIPKQLTAETVEVVTPDVLAIGEGEFPLSASSLPARPWRARWLKPQQEPLTTLTTRPQTQNPESQAIEKMLKMWTNPVFQADYSDPSSEISYEASKLLCSKYKRPYTFDKNIFENLKDGDSNNFVGLRMSILDPPLSLSLPAGVKRVALARQLQFLKCGLQFSANTSGDGDELLVHAAPGCLVEHDLRKLKTNRPSVIAGMIESLISDLVEEIEINGTIGSRMPKVVLNTLKSYACKAAIKFGDLLSLSECNNLIKGLKECKFPFHCAHGRPSVVPLADLDELRCLQTEMNKMSELNFDKLKVRMAIPPATSVSDITNTI